MFAFDGCLTLSDIPLHPSHPQSIQNRGWSHAPITQFLQSTAFKEETAVKLWYFSSWVSAIICATVDWRLLLESLTSRYNGVNCIFLFQTLRPQICPQLFSSLPFSLCVFDNLPVPAWFLKGHGWRSSDSSLSLVRVAPVLPNMGPVGKQRTRANHYEGSGVKHKNTFVWQFT